MGARTMAVVMAMGGIAGCSDRSGSNAALDGGDGSPADSFSGIDSGSSGTDGAESGASSAPAFRSCAAEGAGVTSCGAGGDGCCTSLAVPGGTYDRTYDLDADGGVIVAADGGATDEADPATLSGFRLDKYLVTVGRFRPFVTALGLTDAGPSGYVPAAGSGKHTHLNGGQGLANSGDPGTFEPGWLESDDPNIAPTDDNLACEPPYDTWTSALGSQENLPITCVNWYEAYAFCIWDGGFLPSEAEWEYAAAGGGGEDGQRRYPWGSTAPGTSNQFAIYDCNYDIGPPPGGGAGPCVGVGNIAPVGTALEGAARWGQLDLAGELFEWNLDWYGPYSDCVDCADLTLTSFATDYRVNRGGLFNLSASLLLPAYRNSVVPTGRSAGIGFRCARPP